MAHDDGRYRGHQQNERDRPDRERGRPERLGDRNARGLGDDPYAGTERYGSAAATGFGSAEAGGPMTSDADDFYSAPGFDAEFGGPRFDRADVGSTGTHGVHPVSSAFGSGYGAGYGASAGGFTSSARAYAAMGRQGGHGSDARHDRHYAEWRQRQIDQLDRDYDEYCRERQSRFESDFGAWREQRGRQRQAIGQVREHMEVVGSDGSHVGTVDCTRGDRLILSKSDPSSGGVHHAIPCGWVEAVDDRQVRLNLRADEAMARWREEEESQALFEREGGNRRIEQSLGTSEIRGRR